MASKVLSVIEYRKALKLLIDVVGESPMAATELGDVHCFFCHEHQFNPGKPQHNLRCQWIEARTFLREYGLVGD